MVLGERHTQWRLRQDNIPRLASWVLDSQRFLREYVAVGP